MVSYWTKWIKSGGEEYWVWMVFIRLVHNIVKHQLICNLVNLFIVLHELSHSSTPLLCRDCESRTQSAFVIYMVCFLFVNNSDCTICFGAAQKAEFKLFTQKYSIVSWDRSSYRQGTAVCENSTKGAKKSEKAMEKKGQIWELHGNDEKSIWLETCSFLMQCQHTRNHSHWKLFYGARFWRAIEFLESNQKARKSEKSLLNSSNECGERSRV